MLHADIAPAGADRFVERIVVGDGAELLAIARCGSAGSPRSSSSTSLTGRSTTLVERAGRALGQRIEAADALDLSPKKSSRSGAARARREEIDDAAADRELARLAHRVGAAIAVALEERDQPVERQPPARPQAQHAVGEELARRHALDRGVDRGQHERAPCRAAAASRVSVSMRRLTISALGETRS